MQSKTDSIEEYLFLNSKLLERWMMQPCSELDNEVPYLLKETELGKELLKNFLKSLTLNPYMLKEINHRLHLDFEVPFIQTNETPEDVCRRWLEAVILQDFNTISFLMDVQHQYQQTSLVQSLQKRFIANKLLRRLTSFDVISSGLSSDQQEAFCHYEIQNKADLTLILVFKDNAWKIKNILFAEPQLINAETEAIRHVAWKLSQNDLGNAYESLRKYSEIYFNSSDFQYYWGVYFSMSGNFEKAEEHFSFAIEIEPDLIEALYNLAYIKQTKNELFEATALYNRVLELNPEEIKSLNNLATILISNKAYDKAKQLLDQVLELQPEFELAKKNLERLNELL